MDGKIIDGTKINDIRYLVIDCSALSFCDYAGVETLVEIIDELREKNICVLLAACPLNLIKMIEKMKQMAILEENIYPTITDAVNRVIDLRNRGESIHSGDSKELDNLQSILTSQP